MSNEDTLTLTIAAQSIRFDATLPLRERVLEAMRYVRKHKDDVFWMSGRTNDDLLMRGALAAVMLKGSEEDRDILKRSLAPMKALAALLSGVPVDMERVAAGAEDPALLKIMALWRESEKPA